MYETRLFMVRSNYSFRQTYGFYLEGLDEAYSVTPWPVELDIKVIAPTLLEAPEGDLWTINDIETGNLLWYTTMPNKLPINNAPEGCQADLKTIFEQYARPVPDNVGMSIERYMDITGMSIDAYRDHKGFNAALIPLDTDESNMIKVFVEDDFFPGYKVIINGRSFGEFNLLLDGYNTSGIVDLLTGTMIYRYIVTPSCVDQDKLIAERLRALLMASEVAWIGSVNQEIEFTQLYQERVAEENIVY